MKYQHIISQPRQEWLALAAKLDKKFELGKDLSEKIAKHVFANGQLAWQTLGLDFRLAGNIALYLVDYNQDLEKKNYSDKNVKGMAA
ncbi:MAG: hypothetical protein HY438_01045 [DPANN group archaeon]|nr:hypothetical protein [DPANN group archaeon]